MSRAKICPSPGCEEEIPRSKFACRAHWYSIPKPLRSRLWSAYKIDGVISVEYAEASEACEAFLQSAATPGGE